MKRRNLLIFPILLLVSSCTIAGMDQIHHYEIIAVLIAIAACFIMAFGFAFVEQFHRHYLETGQKRRRTWMVFAITLVVFISLLSLACSGEVTVDTGDYPPMECKGWSFAIGDTVLLGNFDCDDSEWHYQYWMDRKMNLLIEQGDSVARELYKAMWLEAEEVYSGS